MIAISFAGKKLQVGDIYLGATTPGCHLQDHISQQFLQRQPHKYKPRLTDRLIDLKNVCKLFEESSQ
jgi:hypothetical protein